MALDSASLAALIVGYVCYSLCLVLISARLWTSLSRRGIRQLYPDDIWMAFSIIPLLVRVPSSHIVLAYDTNNLDGVDLTRITPYEIHRREIGSKFTLVVRTCLVVFLWCQKLCIAEFYWRLVAHMRPFKLILSGVWWIIIISGIGAAVSVFVECRPFHQYWQVLPDPGFKCTHSPVQLFTFGALDIFTDILLIIFPLPVIYKIHIPRRRKIQLVALFSLGLIAVFVSIFRMPFYLRRSALQQTRTLFASIEMLCACIVANAPVMYRIIRRQDSEASNTPAAYIFSVNRLGHPNDRSQHSSKGSGRHGRVTDASLFVDSDTERPNTAEHETKVMDPPPVTDETLPTPPEQAAAPLWDDDSPLPTFMNGPAASSSRRSSHALRKPSTSSSISTGKKAGFGFSPPASPVDPSSRRWSNATVGSPPDLPRLGILPSVGSDVDLERSVHVHDAPAPRTLSVPVILEENVLSSKNREPE